MPRAAEKAAIEAIVSRIAMAGIRRTTAEATAAVRNKHEATNGRASSRCEVTVIRVDSRILATRTRDASRNTATVIPASNRFGATANRDVSRNTVTVIPASNRFGATRTRDASRNTATRTRDNNRFGATANRDASRNTVTNTHVSEGREMTVAAIEIWAFGLDTITNEAAVHDRMIAATIATIAITGRTVAGKTKGHAGIVATLGHLFGQTGITIGRPGTDTSEIRENIKRKFTRTIANINAGDTMLAGTAMIRTASVGTAAMSFTVPPTIRRMSIAAATFAAAIGIMIKADRIKGIRIIS